ncbi:MAG: hypothetical protein M0R51_15510 [Clostridia bacterium]|jgi:hypothetical protein|nr:hypothetical protein [Clostridia bacterium]
MLNNKVYEITPSLLNSWLYLYNCYEGQEILAKESFLNALNRVKTPTNEAQQAGIDFENKCYAGVVAPETEEIIKIITGGTYQMSVKKIIKVNDLNIMLYGRFDCVKGDTIYDIKKSMSSYYTANKYFHTAQQSIYLELLPKAKKLIYLFNDKNGSTYQEQYNREDVRSAESLIRAFIEDLKLQNLYNLFLEKWEIKDL